MSARRRGSFGALLAAFLLVAASLAQLAAAPRARAGDRRLELLLVDLTPTPTDASRACVDGIARRLREDYTRLARLDAARARARVGGDAARPFLTWSYADLAPLRARGELPLDAVVLVSCAPESGRAELLVTAPAGGATRLTLEGVRLDRARVRWLADTALRQAWVGFVP